MRKKQRLDWLYLITVIVFLLFTLGPLIWTFIVSVTPKAELMKMDSHFLPSQATFENYQTLFDPTEKAHETVFNGLKNSLISSVYTLIIGVPLAVLTSYSMVRFRFKFRRVLLRFFLITIVIPVFTTIIPIFAIFSNYHLLDQLFWISVIYVTAFLPLTTWMLITHFSKIPKEIWEAGELDGCTEWQLFWRVILPLSRPAIITCVLILLLMSWSQFQIPMILTSSQDNKVITLVLSEFMTRDAIEFSMIAASGLLAILPPAIITMIFRKELVTGLTAGSVKG
ncbi:carbohydrate ABC transporter permease [Facklamia miroungae]|uniref:Multiple sugar transport system permease protein n=1 Tax=Facklamia miroungae TaxID=120956 RepID=A0A1G7UZX1_9LACT|nr:carbohydrate ABC transporter permease [Facklamia miroungae]NKZ30208.1 carbohydrate ABC transporter permease [Facklamia miroungae]SDG52838.1 multiple sugar transport system permease protein [Facklamia miroungae]